MTNPIIITDDLQFVSLVEHTLKAAGMTGTHADSMFKAAQLLQGGAMPMAIIVDLATDQALHFIRQVKAHAKFSQFPLLAVTADPSLPEVKEAIQAGANRWITKSFIGNTLLGVMRQYSAI